MTRGRAVVLGTVAAAAAVAALGGPLSRRLPDDAVLFPRAGATYRLRETGTPVRALRVDLDDVRHPVVRVVILAGTGEGTKQLVPRTQLAHEAPAAFLGLPRSTAVALAAALAAAGLLLTAIAAVGPDPSAPGSD
jgi:hypothetical protein